MRWIEYDYVCNENKGITLHKKVEYNEANLVIARQEACNGDYTITEDGLNIEIDPVAVELGGTGLKFVESKSFLVGAGKGKSLEAKTIEEVKGLLAYSMSDINGSNNVARIAAGSYVGTGVCGPDGVVTLTFDFAPKVLMLFDSTGKVQKGWIYGGGYYTPTIGYPQALTTSFAQGLFENYRGDNAENIKAKRSEDGKTISWYHNGYFYDSDTEEIFPQASFAFNSLNTVYKYVAIG